jgi:hypothetical protein
VNSFKMQKYLSGHLKRVDEVVQEERDVEVAIKEEEEGDVAGAVAVAVAVKEEE